MCGIMFMDGSIKQIEFQQGFDRINHRGPDSKEILETHNKTFGFARLSIMDVSPNGMQPFDTPDVTLICNGEIYNYQSLRAQYPAYPYQGDSDCEVLIPMYLDKKEKLAQFLDAEFVFVLYDKSNNKIVAGRDPIGIRPLFYGYQVNGRIAFASEAKALLSTCQEIKPFPIGHVYVDGQFIQYHDIGQAAIKKQPLPDTLMEIKQSLIMAVKKRLMADVPIGYLLSGGLDSSLVCGIGAQFSKQPIHTFAIGMESDAIDLKYAKMVAEHLKSNHHEVIITKTDVLNALPEVIYALESYDITTIRASIGMYLLAKYIKANTDIKVILTGEVSDELFGYKYTDFAPSAEAFLQEASKRMRELHVYDVLRADRCLAAFSLEARVPFGDLDFVKTVMSIDPELKLNKNGIGKYLLRVAFEHESIIPEHILWRQKAAFSDAVGHSLVDYLKEYANEVVSDEMVEQLKQDISHCPITSKESALYRMIFHDFFLNHEKLIPGYWMPNADWVGSDIHDPSARYLSNYHLSGV